MRDRSQEGDQRGTLDFGSSHTWAAWNHANMSKLSSCGSFICWRFVPLLVLFLAIFVGWLQQFDIPEGAVFEIIFTLQNGQLPYHMFGQGYVSTEAVPDDMTPLPRPVGESFLTLPGGATFPQNGIGMCCRSSAYDPESVYNTVLWYLLQGGRHIDGAHLYTNHRAIGRAIKEAMRRGIKREDIFVTTKLWPSHFGYDKPLEVAPTFLEELGLDYVDMILLHFPTPLPYMLNGECRKKGWSTKECRQRTWEAMSKLREDGITRNVGVSNFNIPQMQMLMDLKLAPIATNQFQYNPWAPDWQHEVFAFCQEKGIAVTAYAPMGGAFMKGTVYTEQRIRSVAAKHNKSVPQVMLRWAIQKGAVVIPGTGNPGHMRSNLEAYSFQLDEEDMATIHESGNDPGAKKFMYFKMDDS
jgi:diketogulonate reductase-like aldo/keto reductase